MEFSQTLTLIQSPPPFSAEQLNTTGKRPNSPSEMALESYSTALNICYIPHRVEEEHIPKIGQQFHSLDDARKFYNKYAKHVGFSIRSGSSRKKGDEIIKKIYN
ncbi:hypothetical protein L1049_007976 [Liquidambar formosana]